MRETERVQGFAEGPARNVWVDFGEYKAYLRKGKRRLPGGASLVDSIEIANIEMPEEQTGRGHFTRLLKSVEHYADRNGLVVFVENVQPVRLQFFLLDCGYLVLDGEFPSFIRPVLPTNELATAIAVVSTSVSGACVGALGVLLGFPPLGITAAAIFASAVVWFVSRR